MTATNRSPRLVDRAAESAGLLALPAVILLILGIPAPARPGSAPLPSTERQELPSREELVTLIRMRDRALRTLRFCYLEDHLAPADGPVPSWSRRGCWAFDRGRLAARRWTYHGLPPQSLRFVWTAWDGSRSRTVDFGNLPLDASKGWLDTRELRAMQVEPQQVLAVDGNALTQLGALNSIMGTKAGLFFQGELWSQVLGRTSDMQILGWDDSTDSGRGECLVFLFDSARDNDNGTYELPYCVWLELDTLIPRRVQMYVSRESYARQGCHLVPPETFFRPGVLGEDWVPLLFFECLETRSLEHGVHIAVRARTGAASAGSPFPDTEVRISDPAISIDDVAGLFEPPMTYPLQVVDKVTNSRYVLERPGSDRYSIHDLAFWEMLKAHAADFGGSGDREIELLSAADVPCAADALLFLDRAWGRSTDARRIVEALPQEERLEETAGPETVALAARVLGFHARRTRCRVDDLARLEGGAVAHLWEGSDEERSLHFALCLHPPGAERLLLFVPGVRYWTWSPEELASTWAGEVTLVRPTQELLEGAIQALKAR